MNRLISENILHETIACIANATHNFPYSKVNELIKLLQQLPRENLPDEAQVENPT